MKTIHQSGSFLKSSYILDINLTKALPKLNLILALTTLSYNYPP